MIRRLVLGLFACVAVMTAPLSAQSRVELSGFAGWAFSDGVSGEGVFTQEGDFYNRIDPKDNGIYGFSAGFLVTPQVELGFLYSLQSTSLILGCDDSGICSTDDRDLGDFSISTYHGYFAYNFGEEESPVRPFVLFGLGATSYGDTSFTSLAGVERTIEGQSQFSTTLGGGVKFFFNKNVGARVAGRITPTYIKSDAEGYWCDPYWGCYLVGDAQYSNQFELTGGITFRF